MNFVNVASGASLKILCTTVLIVSSLLAVTAHSQVQMSYKLWSELLRELVDEGEVSASQADKHQRLHIAGVVGSIDNDLVGTDMTVGADSALHPDH